MTIMGSALSPFPLGRGEIPGLPQCVPEPIYVILAAETIPGLDALVTRVGAVRISTSGQREWISFSSVQAYPLPRSTTTLRLYMGLR